ncbi:hypothetical protein ACTMJF_24045 [Escherichia coli]|uniref:hypothetical protein n=1 Tax=Escherichia coli TaxID=562 RepID=UPI003F8C137E
MKKILLALSLLSSSIYAADNVVLTQLSPSHGKVGHKFESYSVHAFYLYNDDNVTHTYHWLIKQCPMYNGRPEVCPENGGGKLTLKPGQHFQFQRTLTMQLVCGAEKQSISTYAMSELDSDNPKDKYLKQEAINSATCS